MDTTDALLKVVHALEYCDGQSRRRPAARDHYRQGYYLLKEVLQEQWGVRLGLSPWRHIATDEMAETLGKPDFTTEFLIGDWKVESGGGVGPHIHTANDGTRARCGGPGVCMLCDRQTPPIVVNTVSGLAIMGVTVETVLSWKERTGQMAYWVFGRRGAHCSQATYDELLRRCDRRLEMWVTQPSLNCLSVHVKEGVPDGVLQRCDCL